MPRFRSRASGQRAPEPVQRLFHVSRSPLPIDALRPFSHFGTIATVRSRAHARVFDQIVCPVVYEVMFSSAYALRMDDLNDPVRSNNHSLLTLTDALHYDYRVIESAERDAVFDAAAPQATNEAGGLAALAKILQDKGFDSVVYRNHFEAHGDDSWINLSSEQVRIVRAVTLDALLQETGLR